MLALARLLLVAWPLLWVAALAPVPIGTCALLISSALHLWAVLLAPDRTRPSRLRASAGAQG